MPGFLVMMMKLTLWMDLLRRKFVKRRKTILRLLPKVLPHHPSRSPDSFMETGIAFYLFLFYLLQLAGQGNYVGICIFVK